MTENFEPSDGAPDPVIDGSFKLNTNYRSGRVEAMANMRGKAVLVKSPALWSIGVDALDDSAAPADERLFEPGFLRGCDASEGAAPKIDKERFGGRTIRSAIHCAAK